jgi:hypothetical protein
MKTIATLLKEGRMGAGLTQIEVAQHLQFKSTDRFPGGSMALLSRAPRILSGVLVYTRHQSRNSKRFLKNKLFCSLKFKRASNFFHISSVLLVY